MPRSTCPRPLISLLQTAFALMFSLFLVACGGGNSERSAATTTGSDSSSTTPQPTAPSSTNTNTSKTAHPTTGSAPNAPASSTSEPTMQKAMFGAGCFWGVEHIFRTKVPGVIDAVSGFSGGHVLNPTYKQVCYEDTGHVEVVQITFDPSKVSYEQLVDYFFRLHDPTQGNRQGPDIGDQYRSVIYYYDDDQKRVAEAVKTRRQAKYSSLITTTVEKADEFYKAEDYHQQYYLRNGKTPYCHVLRPE